MCVYIICVSIYIYYVYVCIYSYTYQEKVLTQKSTREKFSCVSLNWVRTFFVLKFSLWDFPGGTVVGKPPTSAGDTGSSPGPGISHTPRSN